MYNQYLYHIEYCIFYHKENFLVLELMQKNLDVQNFRCKEFRCTIQIWDLGKHGEKWIKIGA